MPLKMTAIIYITRLRPSNAGRKNSHSVIG